MRIASGWPTIHSEMWLNNFASWMIAESRFAGSEELQPPTEAAFHLPGAIGILVEAAVVIAPRAGVRRRCLIFRFQWLGDAFLQSTLQ
jgi:hypothetical protein